MEILKLFMTNGMTIDPLRIGLFVNNRTELIIDLFAFYFCLGIARKLALSGPGVFAMDYPGFGLSLSISQKLYG